jgi:hypothetical protein
MTYEQLYQLCQRQSGNKDADALEGMKLYLNMAQKDMAARLENWPPLQASSTLSLTDGTEEYALASDFFKMRGRTVRITTDNYERTIPIESYSEFRVKYPETSDDTESTPTCCYFSPNSETSLRFYPIPEQSYTVAYDYIKAPSDMTLTSDTPFFNARWHHILADYALALHFESAYEARYDKANFHRSKYEQEADRAVADLRKRSTGQSEMRINYSTGVNE